MRESVDDAPLTLHTSLRSRRHRNDRFWLSYPRILPGIGLAVMLYPPAIALNEATYRGRDCGDLHQTPHLTSHILCVATSRLGLPRVSFCAKRAPSSSP